MQVLLVDDSPLVRATLPGVLCEALPGARVTAVNDLESALERAGGGSEPDLVLLDLGLPGCAGLDALARFRREIPRVPVVVFSATDDRDSIGEALDAGAIGYISKTVSRDDMIAALRQIAAGGIHSGCEMRLCRVGHIPTRSVDFVRWRPARLRTRMRPMAWA